MSRSLALKWIATLLATSLIGVGLVALFAYRATSNEFDRFRFSEMENEFISTVAVYYQEQGSWAGLNQWLVDTNPPPPRPHDPAPYGMFALTDLDGIVVKPAGPFSVGERVSGTMLAQGVPVEVNGDRVASLIAVGPPGPPSREEERYLTRISTAVIIGAVGAVGAALVVGAILSQRMMRPLNELTTAIRAMRHGELDQRIPVRTQDELGELIVAFNQMSGELHRVNHLRRQMTADIAHELRTPLTVITGYLEGLRNGTLQPTHERLEVLHTEAIQLGRLVEDLRTLSLADAGELLLRREVVNASDLLKRIAGAFEGSAAEQGVTITMDVDSTLPLIEIDRERMTQVLTNLMSNALRYSPRGSTITLSARRMGEAIELSVQDQGVGIAVDQVDAIFERFYRADESRSQKDGETSGLGLAIVKSIVEAHGGTVRAESQQNNSIGQGTRITVRLPLHSVSL